MAIWVSVSIVFGILVLVMLRVRARKKQRAAQRTARRPFQSVTVEWQLDACDAVKRLDGKRFIGTEAPSFPLPDCDAEQCACRYDFHGDRRDGDRRLMHGMRHSLIVVSGSEDKRVQDERRGGN